jgi:hypothetical protein
VRIRKPVVIGAATAAMAIMLPLVALPASAGTTPPWEPDPDAVGTLTFYNSSGQQITSGSDLTHLFDYAEASGPDALDGTKAYLEFAAPAPETPPTATGLFLTGDAFAETSFPDASAPGTLATTPNPVSAVAPTVGNLANFIASTTPQTAAGYVNVYQIRMVTTGPGGVGTQPDGTYWDADVVVNPTAGTWAEEYPVEGTTAASTTTTLTASPAGSAQQNAAVTLTATVTASDSTVPAGTVAFNAVIDGISTPIGSAAVNSSGVASLAASTLLPSPPSGANAMTLTATFTPTDSSSYTPSTSSIPYTVNPVANVPTISGPHQAGQKETCSDGTLDFGVTASYTWLASGTKIGAGSSLVVPGSAYKKSLACQVTVSDAPGPASAPVTSASATVSLGKAPAPLKNKGPALSGKAAVGKTVKVKPGTWSVKGVKFKYQWLLNGKTIKGATKSSLKLSKSDNRKKLSCRVTAYETGYANGVATTKSVKVS